MTDFIDRAKLEAMAEERYPMHLPYNRKFEKDAQDRVTFMAGVDAALALLDAETTEEWGVEWESPEGEKFVNKHQTEAQARHDAYDDKAVVRRRVARTPWLPSEGGEKP